MISIWTRRTHSFYGFVSRFEASGLVHFFQKNCQPNQNAACVKYLVQFEWTLFKWTEFMLSTVQPKRKEEKKSNGEKVGGHCFYVDRLTFSWIDAFFIHTVWTPIHRHHLTFDCNHTMQNTTTAAVGIDENTQVGCGLSLIALKREYLRFYAHETYSINRRTGKSKKKNKFLASLVSVRTSFHSIGPVD